MPGRSGASLSTLKPVTAIPTALSLSHSRRGEVDALSVDMIRPKARAVPIGAGKPTFLKSGFQVSTALARGLT